MSSALLLIGAGGALGLLALAARRPALACALLALAVPLSAGMARGAVVPVLRVNEALLLVVAAGFLVHLVLVRRPLAYSRLDVAILGFCALNVIVPWAVILLSSADAALDDWLVVLAPVQYAVVYLVYSRTEFRDSDLRLFFNACMVASLPIAAIAGAEALDLGGVRDLVGSYYPVAAQPSWDPVYRPASLLGHYSAVGAFGLLNLVLALALAATGQRGYPRWWLALVMGANLVSLVASDTYAPLAVLPVGVVAAVVVVRRVPWWTVTAALPVLAAAAVALWPSISVRIGSQFSGTGGGGLPESMQTRVDYWQAFFIPALLHNGPWLGTGTLIPDEVPRSLVNFVDNGYLWQLFRAGVPGLAALFVMLGAVAAVAWSTRYGDDLSRRVLGAACLGAVASVAALDLTSEYLTFTGVSQEFWMLVGLLSGTALAARSRAAAGAFPRRRRVRTAMQWHLAPSPVPHIAAAAATTPPSVGGEGVHANGARPTSLRGLVQASSAVLAGFGLARVLGFLFQVVAGRTLTTDGYGRLTYALAVANIAAVLLTTAPLGLSRFLSRSAGRPSEQEAYSVNWLAVIGLLLGVSALATAAFAGPAGLGGWMLAGLLANLIGVAALETYREVQRGLGRYVLQSVFYVLANALQLVAVVLAAWRGWRSPEVFLAVYGLSAVAALVLMAPWSRGLGLDLGALRWRRMTRIGGFMRPVLLQAVFWNVWFNSDLILLAHLRGPGQTGMYAAAKAIANGFTLIPTAIAFVFAPRVARMPEAEVRGHLLRVLALTAAISVPLALAVAASAPVLTGTMFGARYAAASLPLVVLLAGAVPYGLKSVLGSLWLGLGHPVVETVSSAAAMLVTVVAGLWLIPQSGTMGAAAAFAAGALTQLVVQGVVTAWAFGASAPRVSHLGDREILGDEAPAVAAPSTLVVAEELGETPDEGYVSFVRALEARLAARQPTVLHATRQGAAWTPASQLGRAWQLLCAARLPEVRAARPAAVVYASRSSLTLPALLRARLLRRLCGSPLVFVALQSSGGRLPAGVLLRWLAPDLLLIPTERARTAALAQGVLTATISAGVDLERFRPPLPGERAALRRKWGLSDDRLVLHVGHLREGRNLRVMASIAALPGVTAIVAASSWRGPESEGLRRELLASGVKVLDGYLPNVEELYRLADSYVFPTVASDSAVALPLSVLEALASDLPVVSTAFGALSERFGDVPGLELVESADLLAERAAAACGLRVRTRHLVEPYGWDAITERLAGLLDDLVLEHRDPRGARVGPIPVGAAGLRRAVVDRRGLRRRLLFGGRPGYQARPVSTPPIVAADEPAVRPPAVAARGGDVGVIDLDDTAHPSPVGTAAAFLGVGVRSAGHLDAARLIIRATGEGWPLIGALAGPAPALPAPLIAYIAQGGTVYLDGLDERSNEALARLGAALGVALPEVRRAPPARHLLLASDRTEFARELAGASLETECGDYAMATGASEHALAWGLAHGTRQAAVVQRRAGRGRIVLSVLRRPAGGWPADDLTFGRAGSLVVPLLLLRELYGTAAWHAPEVLANATIDDPALRRGRLGMRYDLLAAQAQDHGFHVTIATVPRELALADEAVVQRLRRRPDLLSACYHGCDHDAYEFYLTAGGRTRHSPRSLNEQRSALLRAVGHGRRFARERGLELDRVMVFPYGVGPASLFADLWRLGFVATCNLGDRYPLEAPTPGDPDLGLRPADLAWGGFPLLWRRGLRDDGYLMDLLLGRPLLLFAHRKPLGRDFAPLAERASTINRMCHGTAVWRGLDEVARHAYLQRSVPGSVWQVLMTANEACLHNPDPDPRTFEVTRPYLPEGARCEVDGGVTDRVEGLRVTVPPRSTAVVRVVARGAAPALRGRRACTVFQPAASLDRLTATSEVTR